MNLLSLTEDHLLRVSTAMMSEASQAGVPGVERRLDTTDDARVPAILIAAGDVRRRARLMCYKTGRVSISGPPEVADRLCAPLASAGLLKGWSAGSQGSGVSWIASGAAEAAPASGEVASPVASAHPQDERRIVAWLESLARAGQRSAGGDLLCMALAAYPGPGGWQGAYEAVARDLAGRGFTGQDPQAAAALLELDKPPAGGGAFVRDLGTIEIADGRLSVRARELDGALEHEVDAGAVYWLRRALRPEVGAPW